ncbi:hypothetical protein M153_199000211 [Pseudoloma neurophilia]|uniref:Uncharacterized protein n=1 Tax=Pseudoloma neurophilia TaxID=146866 RepID=A0A0R0M388_9MICR|nr:hypothetical protein M153_199000211 [Pseudoloma neurophilia]
MFWMFEIIKCSMKPLDYVREAAHPNISPRPTKLNDNRHPESNVNFYNLNQNEKFDQKPSNYDRYMAITQLINAALSDHAEIRMDKLKMMNEDMEDLREAIKENEIVSNPNDLTQKPLNVVNWLANDNSEEKELDQELSEEVEEKLLKSEQAAVHEAKNKEGRYMAERRNTRNADNRSIQEARSLLDVDS